MVSGPQALKETTIGQEALLRRAREGELGAFETLYREHVGRVHAICLRLCGDRARAEDLTQEVFVKAWRGLASFREESLLSSWLHRLAVNVVLDDERSRRRRFDPGRATDDLTALESPARQSGGPPAGDLDRAIAALPPGAREVFVLHDVEGYGHEEIARMTGRSEGTSKSQLHRARRILREMLG